MGKLRGFLNGMGVSIAALYFSRWAVAVLGVVFLLVLLTVPAFGQGVTVPTYVEFQAEKAATAAARAALQSQIDAANVERAALQQAIAALQTENAAQAVDILDLQVRLATAEALIAAHEATLTQQAAAFADHELRLEALEGGAPPPVTPAVSASGAAAAESAGTIIFAVALDTATTATVTVDFATSDGTATAPSDYGAANGTLTFAPGETSKMVSVPIADDSIQETDEQFSFALSNASGAVIAAGTVQGTINDDDSPPPPSGSLSVLSAFVASMQQGLWYEFDATPNGKIPLLTQQQITAICGDGDPNTGCGNVFGTGSLEVIRVWTSAAWDSVNHRLFFGPGGAHSSNNGNEIYIYSFEDDPANPGKVKGWSIPYPPASVNTGQTCNAVSSDPKPHHGPCAAHHYDGLIYAPAVNRLFLFEGGAPSCWYYNVGQVDANGYPDWVQFQCPGAAGVTGAGYYKTMLHPVTGRIVISNGQLAKVATFDPDVSNWGVTGNGTPAPDYSFNNAQTFSAYTTMDGDAQTAYSLNRHYVPTGTPASVYKMSIANDPTFGWARVAGSDLPASLNQAACFLYHPPSGNMVALDDGGEVWVYDPQAVTWSLQDVTGSPALPTASHNNGVFEKCAYIAELDVFAFYNDHNRGMFLYRLPEQDTAAVPPQGFAERRLAPGVVASVGFDTAADIPLTCNDMTARLGMFVNGCPSPASYPYYPAIENGTLKFTVPSNSGAGASGQWFLNAGRFGPGDEVFVQWRQKLSPAFLKTKYQCVGGACGGWKTLIFGQPGAGTCTPPELVVNNGWQRGYPQMYHACGYYEGLEVRVPNSTDFDYQPPSGCLRSMLPTPVEPPCWLFRAGEWATYQLRVRIGTNGNPDSRVTLWAAHEGQPSRIVIDRNNFRLRATSFGKVWLLPYHTGKSASQIHPVGYVWYDDVIVSTQRIPDPS